MQCVCVCVYHTIILHQFTKADKIAASGVLPTTPRPLNNGMTNPNHQPLMVPNMGGTVTMTPVTMPNSGDIPSQRQPTALGDLYSGFTGPLVRGSMLLQ